MVSVQEILIFILGLLISVTIGLWLVKLKKPQHELLRKILTIVKGWWMIFTVLALAALSGTWGVWILFLAISVYGVFEYLGISRLCETNKTTLRFFYSCGTLIFYLLLLLPATPLAYMFAVVFQLVISAILLLQNKKQEEIPLTIAGGVGVFTLIVAFGSAAQVAFLGERIWHNKEAGVAAMLFLIILTSFNDVFQFIGGKLFGKNKIVPHLSPNKTEAGFITGTLGTTLLGSLVFHHFLNTAWGPAFALGAAIGLSGILGDLFLSAVKRSNGVKDFSDLIPGHGGILDRVDSLIFTAPMFLFTLHALYLGVL
ncbi:MAG: phosphatidate cytidylyltransferase [Pseudobdellovibrionaceae bacterium]